MGVGRYVLVISLFFSELLFLGSSVAVSVVCTVYHLVGFKYLMSYVTLFTFGCLMRLENQVSISIQIIHIKTEV